MLGRDMITFFKDPSFVFGNKTTVADTLSTHRIGLTADLTV